MQSKDKNDSVQLSDRYRLYMFAKRHLGGFGGRQIFPIREANPTTLNYIGGILSEKNKLWLEDGKQLSRNFPQGSRVYSDKGISSTLASQAGGLGAKTGLYAVPVLTPDRLEKRQNGRRFKTDGEPMFTLNTQDKHGVYDGYKIRRLTPTECERLMGLPDGWTSKGDFDGEIKEISDTQRYKLCGNGVVVNCVEEIIKRLYNQS